MEMNVEKTNVTRNSRQPSQTQKPENVEYLSYLCRMTEVKTAPSRKAGLRVVKLIYSLSFRDEANVDASLQGTRKFYLITGL